MTVRCEVEGDGTSLVITPVGRLRLPDVSPLRKRMLKCLAEQPGALLVDLSDLHVDEPLALSVFTVVQREASRWPGTPVLLCGPPPQTRAHLLTGAYRLLPVVADLKAAHGMLSDNRRAMPSIHEDLLPIAGSTRHARDVVTDACVRWDLPDLVAPASLIATELVGNVIDHAHTLMTLRLTLRPRQLTIAVRDGSRRRPPGPQPPESTNGRGLVLVASLASSWGCIPSEDGKVMWATLRR